MMQAISDEDLVTVKDIYTSGFSLDKEICSNKTVLECAVEFGSLAIIQFLTERRALLDRNNKFGQNILNLAAQRGDINF